MNFQRPKAQYRPAGQLEYLVKLNTGFVVSAQPFARIDTFTYRNQQLASKGLRWFSELRSAMKVVKIAGHGRLTWCPETKSNGIFFFAKNLQYDKNTKKFTCNGLHYFDMLSDHAIVIKNDVSGVAKVFKHELGMYERTLDGGVITWECIDDPSITFELIYKHRK